LSATPLLDQAEPSGTVVHHTPAPPMCHIKDAENAVASGHHSVNSRSHDTFSMSPFRQLMPIEVEARLQFLHCSVGCCRVRLEVTVRRTHFFARTYRLIRRISAHRKRHTLPLRTLQDQRHLDRG